MDIPVDYSFNLTDKNQLEIPADTRVIFLCGSVYNAQNPADKRIVLKQHLQQVPSNKVIILEEHFKAPSVYGDIDLENLLDVESLVACFANATIIVHESISTGAELGVLGSNQSTAENLLVLYPDTDSVEENKISEFIRLAFYSGKKPALSKDWVLPFSPLLTKNYESNDRYTYHTAFAGGFDADSNIAKSLTSFIAERGVSSLKFEKSTFQKPYSNKPDSIEYHEDKGVLYVAVSAIALRDLLVATLTLQNAREKVASSTSLAGLITILQSELEQLLINTARSTLGIEVASIKITLKGRNADILYANDKGTSPYRKAVGLFVYLLKALGYLDDIKNTRFKLTTNFASFRDQFAPMVIPIKKSAFAKHIQRRL